MRKLIRHKTFAYGKVRPGMGTRVKVISLNVDDFMDITANEIHNAAKNGNDSVHEQCNQNDERNRNAEKKQN